MQRLLVVLASGLGFLAVAAGALGAHALRGRLSEEMMALFETAVRYQMFHALALLALAALAERLQAGPAALAAWLLVGGTLLFSGTLYLISLSGVRWWGMVTPLGGLALLAGWICLGWAAWMGRGSG